MPRYRYSRTKYPHKMELRLNDTYLTKLESLRQIFNTKNRPQTIRASIDDAHARFFTPVSPSELTNNEGGEGE